MARGGYQKPSNPAPVSGPGALSRRTDGGPTQGAKYIAGGRYGEGQALQEMQRSAPMAAAPKMNVPAPKMQAAMTPVTSIFAPTERPDEPFTAGMPFGEGPGPEVLGLNRTTDLPSNTLAAIAQYDETGQVTELLNYLTSRGL